jgi:multiple sugar transport system ATP-binding protein
VLYERPANLFVAGFIGSPAMNMVRSRITEESGAVYATLGETRLRLPNTLLARRATLRSHLGSEVIVGVRPEDIEDAAFVSSANGSAFDVRVTLAEPMGAEVIAHFPIVADPVVNSATIASARADAEEDGLALAQLTRAQQPGTVALTARLNMRTRASSGEPLRIAVDVDRLHFFDAETEESIW